MSGEEARGPPADVVSPSILDRPMVPHLPARLRVAVIVDALVGRKFDFDVLLILEMLLRDLAAEPEPPECVVVFVNRDSDGLWRLEHFEGWIKRFGASLTVLRTDPHSHKHGFVIHQWLTGEEFSDVIAIDGGCSLYWTLMARRFGLAHALTRVIQVLHAPILWTYEQRGEFVGSEDDYLQDFMERETARFADSVATYHKGLLTWLAERDWPVDRLVRLAPDIAPHTSDKERRRAVPINRPSDRLRLMFVGNIDDRYGLDCFLEALTLADKSGWPAGFGGVDFIGVPGPSATEHAVTAIAAAAANWSFHWSFELSDTLEPIFELASRQEGWVVCASALAGGELLRAYCADRGLAFFTTLEMEPPKGGLRSPFDVRTARSVAQNLLELVGGRPQPERKAQVRGSTVGSLWRDTSLPPAPRATQQPLVSVVMVHFNRPVFLHQALYSLAQQNYPNLEVILVDDASPSHAAARYLDQIQQLFAERGWTLVRHTRESWVTAARNEAIELARGDYVMVFDDDNVARRHMITTLVRAAELAGLDMAACFSHAFEGAAFPQGIYEAVQLQTDYLPPGPDIALGALRNVFGDATCLFRRSALKKSGGYREEFGVGGEDHELAARMALAGMKLGVVPEVLYLYRWSGRNMAFNLDNVQIYRSCVRVTEAYSQQVNPMLHDLFRMVLEQRLAPVQLRGESYWQRVDLAEGSVGAALRSGLTGVAYDVALVHYCRELGRLEAAAAVLLKVLRTTPTATEEAVTLLKDVIKSAEEDRLLGLLEAIQACPLPNVLRTDLFGCVAEAASTRQADNLLQAAITALEECDTLDTAAFRALSAYRIEMPPSGTLEARLPQLRKNMLNRGLEWFLLANLIRCGELRSATDSLSDWRRRLDDLASIR